MGKIIEIVIKNRKAIIAGAAALIAIIFDRANNKANAKKAEEDVQ